MEPALLASGAMDGESAASIERGKGRMPFANVRRCGTGTPERVSLRVAYGRPQVSQFAGEAAGEDREATPGLRIEVLIVEMI